MKHILVVDDEIGARESLKAIFTGPYRVTATDASGITSYDAAVVLFHSDTAGAWVAIDDVDARVPGS